MKQLEKNGIFLAAGAGAAAVGAAAWAVRGRSSDVFGPSVWHGDRRSRTIALTFDDGPSRSTPLVLDTLAAYRIPATFFQCGANVEALPEISRYLVHQGHEIGNHSFSHPLFALKRRGFVKDEFARAQESIRKATGQNPILLRVPFGVRWFGFRDIPQMGVMWDVIGLDWKLSPREIFERVVRRTRNGSIICLHDGRMLDRSASVANTVEALRWVLPSLLERGFRFRTVSRLLCPNHFQIPT